MNELTVQIIKVSHQFSWYRKLMGQIFKVYDNRRRDYILKEDYDMGHKAIWRHIDRDDAKIINPVNSPSIQKGR